MSACLSSFNYLIHISFFHDGMETTLHLLIGADYIKDFLAFQYKKIAKLAQILEPPLFLPHFVVCVVGGYILS